MTALILPWLKFALCAALIGAAGPVLTRAGDAIARHTGLSRSWIGLILLATATSLPELFTGISSVTVAAAPNIAVGDALGSCVINLLFIGVLEVLSRRTPLYRGLEAGHVLSAGFGVILIGGVGLLLLIRGTPLDLRILHVSVYTPLLMVLYATAMRAAFVYDRAHPSPAQDEGAPAITLRRAVIRYGLAAAVVMAAGSWLPFVGLELAEVMGWRTTFVGTLFVAGATSLPELVVTISALRLGSPGMAVGNLLGSNLFDVLVLAIDDVFYTAGPLLSAVSPSHAVSAVAAMTMSGVVIAALLLRPERARRAPMTWASASLVAVYLLSAYASFRLDQ